MKQQLENPAMKKGALICTIENINFFYGGWNYQGWHLVYTENENFHVGTDEKIVPNKKDCERIFKNYYEE